MGGDCSSPDCCGGVDRRDFMKAAAGMGAWFTMTGSSALGEETDHFVPADKKLDPAWVRMLFARGKPATFEGAELDRIAMPVGGIGAGQVYLTGDGRLAHFDVFNRRNPTGYGRTNYALDRKPSSPLAQGFAVRVGKTVRALDRTGFEEVRFRGEYPIARVEYTADDIAVSLEAFSPFVPLEEEESGLPATVMSFVVKNRSSHAAEVTLAGWLENAVAMHSARGGLSGVRVNRALGRDGLAGVVCEARPAPAPKRERPPVVFADFEQAKGYGKWTVEGEAFGKGPARGTLARQSPVSGFAGKGLVNTFLGGSDRLQGKLTSPLFTIERPYVSFLVGGGADRGKTCVNLLVDGKVARTATGKRSEKLLWHNWDVRDLAGKNARLEIVDLASGGWGHVNIDQIEFRDRPRPQLSGPLEAQADFGTMCLALRGGGDALADAGDDVFAAAVTGRAERPFGKKLVGAVRRTTRIDPGGVARFTFVFSWCFPNRPRRGNFYATRWPDAAKVADHVGGSEYDRLAGATRTWRDTWYDSTLPHWLLDRLFSTVSTLATSTCQRWKNGRFWAWEGVGCCHGTCAHVWNYEHALARLFPALERSVREMQDLDPGAGFVEETGMVRFRGEGWGAWAGDAQAGTVLKAYREHQMSTDFLFLRRNWKRIRKSLEFLIEQDGDADGLLEGKQHNTYDIDFFGANPMIGTLYLAALRAGEEMAREMGDAGFAATCRTIFEQGSEAGVERLFNGEYFVQKVDEKKHPRFQHGDGCLSDQLFGQGWAHQVGLGHVYPEAKVKSALRAIWKHNWAPDVGLQNARHPAERDFALPGEAGLFTCTWPRSRHPGKRGVRYRDEVWTGIEYQVAGHMAWEGMVKEALALCRGIHERYHPKKHNPYNEVECGDHYARGMASYGVFLALCGFQAHGPRRHLGFAPKITPENFRAAFVTAGGWGTFAQRREEGRQTLLLKVRSGTLRLKTLALEIPAGAKLRNVFGANGRQEGRRVLLSFAAGLTIAEGRTHDVALYYSR